MSKLILVLIGRIEAGEACLEAARQLSLTLPGACIEVLNIRPDPASALVPEEILTEFRRVKLERLALEHATRARALFKAWQTRYGIADDRVEWADVIGDFHGTVIARAHAADFVVLGHAPGHDRLEQRIATRAALLETGRPVLLMPDRPPAALTRRVAVAWHEDAPACRAVLAALPLLEAAERVWILAAPERANQDIATLPAIFSRHHLRVELAALSRAGPSLADALLAKAHALDADLLVMGAYARNHMLQSLFGGFTHEMLARGDLPILMAH